MALTLPGPNRAKLKAPPTIDEDDRSVVAIEYWTPDYPYSPIPALTKARSIEYTRRMEECGAQYYPAIEWSNRLYTGWECAVDQRCEAFQMNAQLQATIGRPAFHDFNLAYRRIGKVIKPESFFRSAIWVAITLDNMPDLVPGWTVADIDSAVALDVAAGSNIELYRANFRFYSRQYRSGVLIPQRLLSIAGEGVMRASYTFSELRKVVRFSEQMADRRRSYNWNAPVNTSKPFFETFMSVYPYYAGSQTDFYSALLALDRLLSNDRWAAFQTNEMMTELDFDAFIGLSPWGYWENQKYGLEETKNFSVDRFMRWLHGLKGQSYIFPCRVVDRWVIDEINTNEGAMYFQDRERENETEIEAVAQYESGVLELVFELSGGNPKMEWSILERAAYKGMASSDENHV